MGNVKILVDIFILLGLRVYGGENVLYLWVYFFGLKFWDIFNEIFEKIYILIVLGRGFGFKGEEFIWVSVFVLRDIIFEVFMRFKKYFYDIDLFNLYFFFDYSC